LSLSLCDDIVKQKLGGQGLFAEYEREMIVARTKSGLERAKKQGKALGK